jgi:hypothetical protein
MRGERILELLGIAGDTTIAEFIDPVRELKSALKWG